MDMMAYETALNTGWILLGAALVFFMQAGFAMVETGFTRAKNAGNIIMKNLMDFSLGVPIFWLIGYGIMFAGEGKLIGGLDLFTNAGGDWATMIFSYSFFVRSINSETRYAPSNPVSFSSKTIK